MSETVNPADSIVHVAKGPKGARAHRETCKRTPADHFETTGYTAVNLHAALPAGCCKPKLPAKAIPADAGQKQAAGMAAIADVLNGVLTPEAAAEKLTGRKVAAKVAKAAKGSPAGDAAERELTEVKAEKAPRAKAGKPEAHLTSGGGTVVTLPSVLVHDAVYDALASAKAVGVKLDSAVEEGDGPLYVAKGEETAVAEAITAHMRAILKEDRSANMYREGKLRGVREALLALHPEARPAKPTKESKEERAAAKVAKLNEDMKAARAAKEAHKAQAAAKRTA